MSKFLQDKDGNNSSTRLLGAFVWVITFGVWTLLSLKSGNMLELPQTIVGVLGITAGWLVFNKHIEINAPAKGG